MLLALGRCPEDAERLRGEPRPGGGVPTTIPLPPLLGSLLPARLKPPFRHEDWRVAWATASLLPEAA